MMNVQGPYPLPEDPALAEVARALRASRPEKSLRQSHTR